MPEGSGYHKADARCLHDFVAMHARERPDALALVFRDQVLTYRELDQRTNRIANHLRSLGVRRECLVGIHMERSLELIVAILAVLKAHGAYVPLDPGYPAERIRFMLSDSRAKVVLTTSVLEGRLGHASDTTIVALDKLALDALPDGGPPPGDPSQLAYVIYTSGSTGKPKGVMVEHRSAANYIARACEAFGTRPDDRVLLFSSINFDASVEEIFTAFAAGAALVIRTDEMVSTIPLFMRAIEAQGITAMSLPTAFARELVNEADALPPALRYVVIGGERAFPAMIARWRQLGDILLWNTYGPTEAAIAVLLGDVSGADPDQEVPLGQPIPGVRLYLLNDKLEPVQPGARGEICVGGVQTARGYLNRPELTAERFVASPFHPGDRLYRTGDLARRRPDGEYEFLGRVDDQIKLRGYRIELGEIESALNEVADAAVVCARTDQAGETRLVAYVVSNNPVHVLKEHIKRQIPLYMMPSLIVPLQRMPVAPGGKIARNDLPEPDWSMIEASSARAAPRNEMERKLCRIWSDVFGISDISIDSNFFDLGGESLQAIRIFTRIEKELKRSLPLAVLFHAPTIAELADVMALDTLPDFGELHPALVPIRTFGSQPPLFCVGGGVINLNNLAGQLGSDQPFYALQWRGLSEDLARNGTLAEIAATFIEAMRSVQEQGPYRLAGSFTAGMVAVEMARQLEERGERVELLAGFDTVVADGNATADPRLLVAAARRKSVLRRVAGIIAKGPAEIMDHLTNPYYREQIQLRIWKVAVDAYAVLGLKLPVWLRTGMGEEYFIHRVTRYHVPERRFGGEMRLFLTPQYHAKFRTIEKFGWDAWVGGAVHVEEVPGEPCTIMLPPNVGVLAAKLAARLDAVGRSEASPVACVAGKAAEARRRQPRLSAAPAGRTASAAI